MAERDRIARYFAPLTLAEPGSFALTDDAAVLTPPPGTSLVITTDSVIENIHVLLGATASQFAQKLMLRNLSDLAAMGAEPWRYTLNVHTPRDVGDAWFAEFAATLAQEQSHFGCVLIGGDSTTGGDAIHVTMTCFGLLEGASLRRSDAKNGDDIYVSGTLGGAAYALQLLQQKSVPEESLAARYHRPEPRLALGRMLHGIASSCIDISDGLVSDVAQICAASNCAAVLEASTLPLHPSLADAALDDARTMQLALSGGDDYELCFTASADKRDAIAAVSATLELPITRIGKITSGSGVKVFDASGEVIALTRTGYEH